jgi:hypothetical protein
MTPTKAQARLDTTAEIVVVAVVAIHRRNMPVTGNQIDEGAWVTD